MTRLKKVLIAGAGALVLMQLVPLRRTNPPVTADFDGPADVERILRRSCYDCHSNETVWSWTAYLAPGSFLVVRDVHKARDEFNLSDWGRMSASDRAEIAHEMVEEVEEGEMPMPIYLVIHPEAEVSSADLSVLRNWASAFPDEERRRGRGRGGDDETHED